MFTVIILALVHDKIMTCLMQCSPDSFLFKIRWFYTFILVFAYVAGGGMYIHVYIL